MGKFSKIIKNHHNKVNFTTNDGKAVLGIDIFKTNNSIQKVLPAIYVTGSKKTLEMCIAALATPSSLIAKTNAAVMGGYYQPGDAFYGLYYDGNSLYMDGAKLIGNNDTKLYKIDDKDGYGSNEWFHYNPSFCIKSNGNVEIKWFKKSNLFSQYKNYSAIIGASHPLVYNSQSAFNGNVYEKDFGVKICSNWSGVVSDAGKSTRINNKWNCFNDAIASYSSNRNTNRTY